MLRQKHYLALLGDFLITIYGALIREINPEKEDLYAEMSQLLLHWHNFLLLFFPFFFLLLIIYF